MQVDAMSAQKKAGVENRGVHGFAGRISGPSGLEEGSEGVPWATFFCSAVDDFNWFRKGSNDKKGSKGDACPT